MKGPRARFAVLAALVGLWHLVIGSVVGLGDAEALYGAYALNPAASYLDHPPMIGWLLLLTTTIGGLELWSIRAVATICHLATLFGVYRLALEIYGHERAGARAAALMMLLPMFSIGALASVPDAPATALWVWALVLVVRLLREARERRRAPPLWKILLVGAALGATFLAKYTGILLVVAVVVMLTHSRHRFLLRQPRVWLAALVCAAVVSPVVWWNAQHGWASLMHRFLWTQGDPGPSWATVLQTLGGQLAYGGVVVIVLAIVLRMLWRRRAEADAQVLLWSSAVPLGFTLLLCLASSAAEPHWTAQGYVALVVAAGGLTEELESPRFSVLLKASVGFAVIAFVAAHLVVLTPLVPWVSGEEYEPRYDLAVELTGWSEVSRRALELRRDREPVVSNHYTICSQLLVSMTRRDPSSRRRLRCVTPETDDFDLWGLGEIGGESSVIYVEDDRFGAPPSEVLSGYEARELERLEIRRFDEVVRTFTFYRATQRSRAAIR